MAAAAGESPPPSPSPLPVEMFMTPKKFVKLHSTTSLEDYYLYLNQEEAACMKLKEKQLTKAELRDVNARLLKVHALRSNDSHISQAYKSRQDRLARDDRKERMKAVGLARKSVKLNNDIIDFSGRIYDGVFNPSATAPAVENGNIRADNASSSFRYLVEQRSVNWKPSACLHDIENEIINHLTTASHALKLPPLRHKKATSEPTTLRTHLDNIPLTKYRELLAVPNVRSTASAEKKKPKKIRYDKNKGSRVTAFAGKKRRFEDDDEDSDESEDDDCTALERSMVTLSAEYAPGSDTFSEDCHKLWQDYLAHVERRRMSPNSVQAQKGRHQALLAEWYAGDTAFAEFFVDDMAKKYETATIAIDRSAAQALTLSPISADLTASAENFNILSTWDKLWSRKPDFPEQFVNSVAAGLFVDYTASAAPAFEVEADTKVPATRILSDIVAFLGTKLTFALELAHNLGNGKNKSSKVGIARSDFAITSSEDKNVGRAGAAVLIAEFAAGADAWPVHKDTFVATAEAVYESHRLLGHLPLADVSHARMHVVLCSDRVVKFQVIQPIYRRCGIFFERNTEGPVFDLSKSLDFGDRLANALRMARYVQDVVFQDAYRLRGKIKASVQDRTVELLPTLPTEIPPQRPPGAITPVAKRRKT
ncbi:hypothetical protein BDZ88DRAFT_436689 [Geranomyces variabilis]|nr:hypothetical protein BDZ88DRAFT_436689 [Geranomyces variabilis]